MSTPRRLEQSLAQVCQLITLAAGIKKDSDTNTPFSAADFMPHEDGYAESQKEITLEDFVAMAVANNDL